MCCFKCMTYNYHDKCIYIIKAISISNPDIKAIHMTLRCRHKHGADECELVTCLYNLAFWVSLSI